MSPTLLLTENQLDEWVRANSRLAQGVVVELVARLVAASVHSPTARRFPLGDSIGQPGPDGYNESDGYDPYLPSGKSYWEIGTGVEPRAKATDDYRDLTAAVPPDERQSSTFVFVTPLSARRGWAFTWKRDAQARWRTTRLKRRQWGDVRVLDGTQLVEWLAHFPAVERWLLRDMGMHAIPIESFKGRWDDLRSIGDPPPLPPELFLANRGAAQAKVEDVLSGNLPRLRLDTYYPDQVPDFVAAIAAGVSSPDPLEISGRGLIARSLESIDGLLHLSDRHVFVADFDIDAEGAAGTRLLERIQRLGHAVIFGGLPGGLPDPNRALMPSPKRHQVQDALEGAGYPKERARNLATRSAGNLGALLRVIQNLSSNAAWAESDVAAELAIANLLGGWNEANAADVEIIEELATKPYGEWIAALRSAAHRADTPLQIRGSAWTVVSRFEAWYALGPRLLVTDLQRFREAAVRVLGEDDPKFELPAEDRMMAAIRGKITRYSGELRAGIAETVALLGAHELGLTSIPAGVARGAATRVVHTVLSSNRWETWASLDYFLPALAEAAPEAYLERVESALATGASPFEVLFAEERPAFSGGTLVSGLLWSLESLAWNDRYLARSLLVLSALANRDPGGSWSNRPIESLTTILRPWFPQTTAPAEAQQLAVNALVREFPTVGWQLMLRLLPSPSQISTPTHRPKWRQWIPDDWSDGTTVAAYREQVQFYIRTAVDLARTNAERMTALVEHLEDLPNETQDYLLSEIRTLTPRVDEEARTALWNELVDLVTKHRAFADATWALPEERVAALELAAREIEPTDPVLRHRRLFSDRDIDLLDRSDWEGSRDALGVRRSMAIREVLDARGIDGVLTLADRSEAPWKVGIALAGLETGETDLMIMPDALTSESPTRQRFAGGYVWARYRSGGTDWVGSLPLGSWSKEAVAQFFAELPFDHPTWTMAHTYLGRTIRAYWAMTHANPFDVQHRWTDGVRGLLLANRPLAAVRVLAVMKHRRRPLPPKTTARVLIAALKTGEQQHQGDAHDLREVISALQDHPRIDAKDLFAVEWAYLPLLDTHDGATPEFLQSLLASDPSFFMQVVRAIFKPTGEAADLTRASGPTDEERALAENAYRLVQAWSRPPGLLEDGSFSTESLNAWWEAAAIDARASGHSGIAASLVGHALAHAPRDPDGLWIARGAAALLDKAELGDMREGFRTELYNARGAHFVGGGEQETELADRYMRKAEELESAGFHRLGATVRALAETYQLEAEEAARRATFDDV